MVVRRTAEDRAGHGHGWGQGARGGNPPHPEGPQGVDFPLPGGQISPLREGFSGGFPGPGRGILRVLRDAPGAPGRGIFPPREGKKTAKIGISRFGQISGKSGKKWKTQNP